MKSWYEQKCIENKFYAACVQYQISVGMQTQKVV